MTYRPKPITGRTGPQPGYAVGGVVTMQPTGLMGDRCEPAPTFALRRVLADLAQGQRRLGAEFEAVLDAHIEELYEP